MLQFLSQSILQTVWCLAETEVTQLASGVGVEVTEGSERQSSQSSPSSVRSEGLSAFPVLMGTWRLLSGVELAPGRALRKGQETPI